MGNFNRSRSGDSRNFRKRDFGGDRHMGRPQMSSAVCDSCGKECQVPFKPTGEKPVYCRDCYAKMNGGNSRNNFRDNNRGDRSSFRTPTRDTSSQSANEQQLREINVKLDKILELLNSPVQKIVEAIQEEKLLEKAETLSQPEEVSPKKVKRPAKKKVEPSVE